MRRENKYFWFALAVFVTGAFVTIPTAFLCVGWSRVTGGIFYYDRNPATIPQINHFGVTERLKLEFIPYFDQLARNASGSTWTFASAVDWERVATSTEQLFSNVGGDAWMTLGFAFLICSTVLTFALTIMFIIVWRKGSGKRAGVLGGFAVFLSICLSLSIAVLATYDGAASDRFLNERQPFNYNQLAEIGHAFYQLEYHVVGNDIQIQSEHVATVVRLLPPAYEFRVAMSRSPAGTLAFIAAVFDGSIIGSILLFCVLMGFGYIGGSEEEKKITTVPSEGEVEGVVPEECNAPYEADDGPLLVVATAPEEHDF